MSFVTIIKRLVAQRGAPEHLRMDKGPELNAWTLRSRCRWCWAPDNLHQFRTWTSERERNRRLAHWLHIYNHHRHHTAVGGPPASRVGKPSGHYT